MRIAFSGTHRAGKSTLLEEVAGRLRGYEAVDEPYYLLEEDGYEAAEEPSIEDFEAQLVRSLEELEVERRDVLFDRCPVDVLAYLLEHADADAFEAGDWLERVQEAVRTLDLVVLVPLERPDRIAVGGHEDAALRRAVDERLRALLIDGDLATDVEVLEVAGTIRDRADQVVARIAGGPQSRTRTIA